MAKFNSNINYNNDFLKSNWQNNDIIKPAEFNELSKTVINLVNNNNKAEIASTEQAEQGIDDTTVMTPSKVKQSIIANTHKIFYSIQEIGSNADASEIDIAKTLPVNSTLYLYIDNLSKRPPNYYKNMEARFDGVIKVYKANEYTAWFEHYDVASLNQANLYTAFWYSWTGDGGRTGFTGWIQSNTYGVPIGSVIHSPILLRGYVKLNGATVNRSDYNLLAKFAEEYNLWTSNPSAEPWKFGRGDGSSTMVLPDYRNRFVQGGDSPSVREAGLPNFKGSFVTDYAKPTGNITAQGFRQSPGIAASFQSDNSDDRVTIDLSKASPVYGRSNTVQPPAIVLIPQMRYI